MLSFENDYSEGVHPAILDRFAATNMVQESGYGTDIFTQSAKEKIREAIGLKEATIHFLVGGTQTNQIVIDSLLRSYEGVIAADTGHISTHEAGAIEYSGHKVLTIPAEAGKLSAASVANYLQTFYADANHTHMVYPGMVYISYPTEYGTLYTKEELTKLSQVCQDYEIPLFIDGARLGYGLASPQADLTFADIAALSDVFYIGGTKIGALCGEAVVFTKQNEPKHFTTFIKQHGALLAKGRLLGIQFDTLFTDDLYLTISQHAVAMAMILKEGMIAKGYPMYLDSPTNQQFFILHKDTLKTLESHVKFSRWENYDDQHQVVRFATSWATSAENIAALLAYLPEV
ncbi:aminotransferase class I/II-fold pyridoxal phosphate-dependent enzyme [Enterococcus sp.]|uniref:threonine aldolase family protein n=1 Tax=Enterococcus sp. TaxID=35783 RepID=UPI00289640E4|nr:aminotransferase class I/II-fold pyridoxal phosphate-dependent enzyme [Enterococcus sp.]